jgi:hypothetical protein
MNNIPTIQVGETASPPEVREAFRRAVEAIFAQPDATLPNVLETLALVIANTFANIPINWPKYEMDHGISRNDLLDAVMFEAKRVLNEVDCYDRAGHA